MTKTAFNKKSLFTSKLDLKFKKGTSKMEHLKYCLEWCRNLDTSESR
jgi:hypothetical protein